ncbi:MAG: sulfite exporter TauE/SafE family protein [Verrucomicrobiota bacterium]
MIDPETITGPTTAFFAGVVTSVHCVGMCGPLACAFLPQNANEKANPVVVTSVYHGARVLAYTGLGAIAGAIGAAPFAWFDASALTILPWALVLFFVAIAFGLEKRIPKPKIVSKWFFRFSTRVRKLPRTSAGGLLGLVTPFLPCGPLYLVIGVALVTGSAINGAEFLFAFALGTLPLIWLTHTQYARIQTRISPLGMRRIQQGMALVLASMIALRLVAGPDLNPPADLAEVKCPLCDSGS